jgi:hypothetical protein
MKTFFVLVALLGVSLASFGCGGGETPKKAPEPAPTTGGEAPKEGTTP